MIRYRADASRSPAAIRLRGYQSTGTPYGSKRGSRETIAAPSI
jgi:hypothetical protein